MQKELKTRQVCLFLIAFTPIAKLFIMPSVLAGKANEDLWICTLINVVLDFFTIASIIYACKNTDKNLTQLLESSFGKLGAKFIIGIFFIYFILKAILPISEQADYVKLTLYTLKPTVLYFLPFFIVAFYVCTKNLRVLGRSADILWLFTIIGFLILFALSIANIDFGAILPLGANGVKKIIDGSYTTLLWFGDGAYLLFLMGEFKFRKNDGKKIILSFLVSSLIVLLFMIIFYGTFTYISHRQRFAFTEISKYTSVINNLGRFDYIGILLILFSNVFALSVPLFFASKSLDYILGFSKKWISPLIVIGIQLFILIFLNEYYASVENFLMSKINWFFLIVGNILPALCVFLIKKESKKQYAIEKI